jgi:glycosyltransferase involved in cell wall biosynthesis
MSVNKGPDLLGGSNNCVASMQHTQDLIEDDDEHGAELLNPIDGLKITNHRQRMRAWRKMARKRWMSQPNCFERGKSRWHGKVEYNSWKDKITWNGHPLPGSRCWKSNAMPGEHLGKVILVLMMKNESAILERMLSSFIDDIDGFVILDTGSTDRSREIAWEILVEKHKKRGHIYMSEWYDFGSNRTITVQLAHGAGDWLYLLDADYVMEYRNEKGESVPQFNWLSKLPPLSGGAPMMLLLGTSGSLSYARPHVVRGDVLYCFENMTHEFLSRSVHDKSGVPIRQESFPYVLIDHRGDGGSKADKLPRDVVLCLMDLLDRPDAERPAFYLANTLRQLRMPYEARFYHKLHMKRCGWNEEQLCSAKGALETMWLTKESNERQLAMVLHASFQNPERLEMLSQYLRKIRSTPSMWPAWSHLAACIGSMFTHNEYPATQKLFIERWENVFGIWQELSIACFYCPQYFELGLFMSRKLMQDAEFGKQLQPVKDMTQKNRDLFEGRLKEWVANGVLATPAIRRHLMERAHRFFAQARFARAKELYSIVLHPIVMRDAISDESLLPSSPEKMAEEAKAVGEYAERLSNVTYHKAARLSAWCNGKPLHHAVTESDQERALCCYQMGRCEERMSAGPTNKLLVAVHYVNALKLWPLYPPALAALYDMTHLAPPDMARVILYLIRAATSGPAHQAASVALRPVKAVVEALAVDQSNWCKLTPLAGMVGTSCILPIVPNFHDLTKRFAPADLAPEPNQVMSAPRWMPLIQPTVPFRGS